MTKDGEDPGALKTCCFYATGQTDRQIITYIVENDTMDFWLEEDEAVFVFKNLGL